MAVFISIERRGDWLPQARTARAYYQAVCCPCMPEAGRSATRAHRGHLPPFALDGALEAHASFLRLMRKHEELTVETDRVGVADAVLE